MHSLNQWFDAIENLHEVEIASPDATAEVYQRTVDEAVEVFSCDIARLAVVTDGQLIPTASSSDEPLSKCDPIPVTTGYAGQTYKSGEAFRIDDLTNTRSTVQSTTADEMKHVDTEQPRHRALLSVSIGDRGILQLFATEPAAFTTKDETLADRFANQVQIVLDNVETETELRQERDQFEEFASVVSHELRNPLQILRGTLDSIAKTDDLDHIERGYRALDRMETIIDELLILARQGERTWKTETVSIGKVVEQCWKTVKTYDGTLVIDTELQIVADPDSLRHFFENLLRNAVEHGGEDVTVTVGELNDGFYVADDGPGIPSTKREAIFEYGYSTTSDGTGLGLAIVETIATEHGWTVTVTNGEDGGARFELCDVELVE